MNSVEVNLLDADTGKEYKLQLSPKSAIRAQTDLSFATTLFNVARQTQFQNTACLGKKVWDEIATIMNSKGYDVSSRQCMTRINTMKRTYKTIKDHNSRSGNNKRTWKYYDAMESFLGEKRYMSPLTLISSTGESSFAKSEFPSSCNSSSTCQSDGTVIRKRKAADIIDNITENRRVTEDGKNKRHKERMEMQQKFIERLDKILKKL